MKSFDTVNNGNSVVSVRDSRMPECAFSDACKHIIESPGIGGLTDDAERFVEDGQLNASQ